MNNIEKYKDYVSELEKVFVGAGKKPVKKTNLEADFKKAIFDNDAQIVEQCLKSDKTLATRRLDFAKKKISPLLYATAYKFNAIFDLLINAGAKPDSVSSKDDSIYFKSVEVDNLHVFKYFYDNSITADTYNNTTPSFFNLNKCAPESIIEFIIENKIYTKPEDFEVGQSNKYSLTAHTILNIQSQELLEKIFDEKEPGIEKSFDYAILERIEKLSKDSEISLKRLLTLKFQKLGLDGVFIHQDHIGDHLHHSLKFDEKVPISFMMLRKNHNLDKIQKLLSINLFRDTLVDFINKNPKSLESISSEKVSLLLDIVEPQVFTAKIKVNSNYIENILENPRYHMSQNEENKKVLSYFNNYFPEIVTQKMRKIEKSLSAQPDHVKIENEKWLAWAQKVLLSNTPQKDKIKIKTL